MSDGISQLVAIGAQDAFLTGNPEISFFRSTYKRHTNFSHVTTRQVIQGNPSNNAMSTVRFERKGDLLNHVYILCTEDRTANALANWSNIVSSVDLLIGGQVIDTQYPEFSENLAPELLAQNLSKSSSGNRSGATSDFFPLRFSFFENCQSAIPLVSLQYHDVEIRINWGTIVGSKTFEVYANFIYLDTDERQLLSNSPQNMISLLEMYRKRAEDRAQSNLTFFNKINPNAGLSNSIYDYGIDTYDYDQQLELEDPLGYLD